MNTKLHRRVRMLPTPEGDLMVIVPLPLRLRRGSQVLLGFVGRDSASKSFAFRVAQNFIVSERERSGFSSKVEAANALFDSIENKLDLPC